MEQYDAIYARQSVDRVDSISIESQIEYCQYETRGGSYQTFIDKGYSGKNTARPQLQAMMEAIHRGEIKRVIVYKLDRISRSILDFANMMAAFQECHVEFVSCTEKFDTSTPMGRAMLNICIVFAQLERETIQMRVEDAYISRSRKGFYMGGRVPYGYRLEPYMIDGKKTSRYSIDPAEAEIVKLIFSMYAEPQTSYGDIVRYLAEKGILNDRTKNGVWDRCRIAEMIKNPIYVKADLRIYRFYKDQGTIIHNSPEDFVGIFGCYLYSDKNAGRKQTTLENQHIVLAPHEGIVSPDVWLKARLKCLGNKQVAKPIKAKNTWLAGKIKCGKCGYALTIKKSKTRIGRYFICSRRMQTHRCEGVGGIDATAFENLILAEMTEHLTQFETLKAPREQVENPRVHEISVKLEQITAEIEKLMDKVADADRLMMEHINRRIHELDAQANDLRQEYKELSLSPLGNQSRNDLAELRDYMSHWEELSFDDKRAVIDQLIVRISATEDGCKIEWKI